MTDDRTISPSETEGIDFYKLSTVVRNNWIWLLLVFLFINSLSLIYLRYTKNLYQSDSELKLDVKNEATSLGITSVVEDPYVNLLSGEIEIIQSKLFLSKVLRTLPLNISYYSIGRVTREELFIGKPFAVTYEMSRAGYYNIPIYIDFQRNNTYTLRVNEGQEIQGRFDEPLQLDGIKLTISQNPNFVPGDEVGYYFTINSADALLNYLSGNLLVEPINYNANTIRISFKDHNPVKAQTILHRIDTMYLQYSYEQKNQANRQKIDWLTNELSVIEKKMESFEDYFENFTLEHKSNNLDADLMKIVGRIQQLDSQRYHSFQKLSRLTQLQQELEADKYYVSVTNRQYLPDGVTQNLDNLYKLILEQEKLKMSYNEVTFAFQRTQKDIEALREKVVQQLKQLQHEASSRLSELTNQKRKLESEFADLPDKNTEFAKNMRFYKLNEQLYLSLMQSKSQFEVMQAGTITDFKILSPASLPITPIAPKKTLIAGAGFVMSLVAILFLIGVSYLINNKITSLQELQRVIQLPVLGVVPSSPKIRSKTLYVLDHPKSIVTESMRTIRTNLDFFNSNRDKKVFAITSTVAGEGKSFFAANLGAIMGMTKKKVILLDLDLRKPKTDTALRPGNTEKGVSTILIHKHTWQECIIKTPLDQLDYIFSGPIPPNPAELLMNGEFHDLLDDLKKHYDIILLDTPPVGLVTDGIMAMKNADLSIYLFRSNYSKREFVSNLSRIVNINKFDNIAVVLNALPSNSERRYGYGYYEEATQTWWQKIFKR